MASSLVVQAVHNNYDVYVGIWSLNGHVTIFTRVPQAPADHSQALTFHLAHNRVHH